MSYVKVERYSQFSFPFNNAYVGGVLHYGIRVYKMVDNVFTDEDCGFASPIVVIGSDLLNLIRGSNPSGSMMLSSFAMEKAVSANYRTEIDIAGHPVAYSYAGVQQYLDSIVGVVEISESVMYFIKHQLIPMLLNGFTPIEDDDDDLLCYEEYEETEKKVILSLNEMMALEQDSCEGLSCVSPLTLPPSIDFDIDIRSARSLIEDSAALSYFRCDEEYAF
jgi:hypothetical protein